MLLRRASGFVTFANLPCRPALIESRHFELVKPSQLLIWRSDQSSWSSRSRLLTTNRQNLTDRPCNVSPASILAYLRSRSQHMELSARLCTLSDLKRGATSMELAKTAQRNAQHALARVFTRMRNLHLALDHMCHVAFKVLSRGLTVGRSFRCRETPAAYKLSSRNGLDRRTSEWENFLSKSIFDFLPQLWRHWRYFASCYAGNHSTAPYLLCILEAILSWYPGRLRFVFALARLWWIKCIL